MHIYTRKNNATSFSKMNNNTSWNNKRQIAGSSIIYNTVKLSLKKLRE